MDSWTHSCNVMTFSDHEDASISKKLYVQLLKPTHTYEYSDQLIYAHFHVYTCDCAWLTHLPKKLQQYMKLL